VLLFCSRSEKFLPLGFDLCWFGSKVCSFISFTTSFLVLGGVSTSFVSFVGLYWLNLFVLATVEDV